MTSLVQAWCSLPGMLERGIARLSDLPPAPRYWAEPPQESGHRSVPEKAGGGTRGSGKQPQVEPRRWRCEKIHPRTAGERNPRDDWTKVLQKDAAQVKNIPKLLTWMTSWREQRDQRCSDTCQCGTVALPNYINNTAENQLYLTWTNWEDLFFLLCL